MSADRPWNLGFEESAEAYQAAPQRARVWTESWVAHWAFCPHCNSDRLKKLPANNPVGDFVCERCDETYELKSQQKPFGARIVDGALRTMLERLASNSNPNLFLLKYDAINLRVDRFAVVPKHYFASNVIEPRKPLGPLAKRAGWTGCNIHIAGIPASGFIEIVRDGAQRKRDAVLTEWRHTLFLRDQPMSRRGWLLEVLMIVEKLPRVEFSLAEVYEAEAELSRRFPGNNNVRPKIRQQLQVLRDSGVIEFLGDGAYRKRTSDA